MTSPWYTLAACKGQTYLFFPPEQGGHWDTVSAVGLCRTCPVLKECGQDARKYERGAVTQIRAGCILPEQYTKLPR